MTAVVLKISLSKEMISTSFLFDMPRINSRVGIIHPAKMAGVNMCREINSHLSYTLGKNIISMEDVYLHGEDNEDYAKWGDVDHTSEYD